MKLHILRTETGDQGTFSTGTAVDLDAKWDFIELPWRQNKHGISCIPAGTEIAKLVDSDHFKRKVYLFVGVKDRDAIEMHPANWAGDISMGYRSDLRGCCAPGKARGIMPPPPRPNDPPGKVYAPQACVRESVIALDEIIKLADGEDLEVTFEWADGVNPE